MSEKGRLVAAYVVFGSTEEAQRIGRSLVERRIAACVNILGSCRSIYRWQGKVEEADEVTAIVKTSGDRIEAMVAAIRSEHGYDVPAIAVLPVLASHEDYESWVVESAR